MGRHGHGHGHGQGQGSSASNREAHTLSPGLSCWLSARSPVCARCAVDILNVRFSEMPAYQLVDASTTLGLIFATGGQEQGVLGGQGDARVMRAMFDAVRCGSVGQCRAPVGRAQYCPAADHPIGHTH